MSAGKTLSILFLIRYKGWREAEVLPRISVQVQMHLAKRHYL